MAISRLYSTLKYARNSKSNKCAYIAQQKNRQADATSQTGDGKAQVWVKVRQQWSMDTLNCLETPKPNQTTRWTTTRCLTLYNTMEFAFTIYSDHMKTMRMVLPNQKYIHIHRGFFSRGVEGFGVFLLLFSFVSSDLCDCYYGLWVRDCWLCWVFILLQLSKSRATKNYYM